MPRDLEEKISLWVVPQGRTGLEDSQVQAEILRICFSVQKWVKMKEKGRL